ncbi:MAG TPA: ATP-grasp domain-containing protein [Candidatus Angelobacter sp.]|nr:ATP-grasp domain-containing protein [Candidatus Angelobacter sp.]
MRALILDGHSRAALETLQSLGRTGVQVDIAAEGADCLAFHSRYTVNKLRQPSQSCLSDFHTWLREHDQKCNYELIVPATEASLLGLRALAEDDPLRRKAVLPANQALDIALDKEKTRLLAKELGVPVPESTLISSIIDIGEIGQSTQFPLVLKPTHSKIMVAGELRTLAAIVVKNETQRQEQLRRWLPYTPVLQQQYVQGRGVGAEFLFDRGKKIWHFVHERVHEYPLSGGASSYRRSIRPPDVLLRDAEKLLTSLNWHGVAMVEFKMNAGGQYWLMEINPRLWGSLALSVDAGVNFPLGLLQLAHGQQPQPQPNYKLVYTRDLRTDLDWLKANLVADPQDPLLLTRSRTFSLLELLRPLTGRESWDHFDWRDLSITWRILGSAFSDQLRPVARKIKGWRTQQRWWRHHKAVLQRLTGSGLSQKIVFLCYGNICRSPLAAKLAAQKFSEIAIESAGFHEPGGRTCPEKMLRIGKAFGVDLSQHRSTRVTRQQLLAADLVIAMDLENISLLKQECPEVLPRTTLLGLFADPASVSIADPYLADESAIRTICGQVRSGIEGMARSFAQTEAVSLETAVPARSPR